MLTEVAGAVTVAAFDDAAAPTATVEPVVVKFQRPLVQVAIIFLVPFRLNTLVSPKNPGFITRLPPACAAKKVPKCVTLLEIFVLVVPRPVAFADSTHNAPVATAEPLELAAINIPLALHPVVLPRTRGALIPWQKPVLGTVKVISPDIFVLVKNTEESFAILKPELALEPAKPTTVAVLIALLEVNGVNCGLISVLSVE